MTSYLQRLALSARAASAEIHPILAPFGSGAETNGLEAGAETTFGGPESFPDFPRGDPNPSEERREPTVPAPATPHPPDFSSKAVPRLRRPSPLLPETTTKAAPSPQTIGQPSPAVQRESRRAGAPVSPRPSPALDASRPSRDDSRLLAPRLGSREAAAGDGAAPLPDAEPRPRQDAVPPQEQAPLLPGRSSAEGELPGRPRFSHLPEAAEAESVVIPRARTEPEPSLAMPLLKGNAEAAERVAPLPTRRAPLEPARSLPAAAAPRDEIKIQIGRIEVIAVPSPAERTPAARPRSRGTSLDEYLRRRDRDPS